ncbi:hypothetical protein OH787_40350 (plasmid) [Streptomyces sp. NBC_01547]|uniref:hypothetical protein n=1 Tax=Streptomyces sp. NBC_01547 TaxID=2975873 RepID=UPI002F90E81E
MSDTVKSTEQDRLERLGSLLSGSRSSDRASRALGQGGSFSNMLLGVMLHGADRVRQGQTPTDLERPLLDALRTVVSDAEMRQWGSTYRDLVAAQGQLAMLPEAITSRPVSQGYAMADLGRDIRDIVAEALASPNVQIVDPFAAAAGKPEDPAFVNAMRETGLAVTAYARPPKAAPSAAAASSGPHTDAGATEEGDNAPSGQVTGKADGAESFQVQLELESFFVERAVGDAGGSRDEIYWVASTSAGQGGGKVFTSEEFGAVKKGDTRRFAASNNVLFEGTSSGFIGTSIQVWEADQSSDEWWNALVKALNTAVNLIDEKLTFLDLVGVGIPQWAGVAWEIGKLFVTFIDIFRNYDDLSCSRMIGMDRQDLAVLSHRGHTVWNFNGDGHHTLKVKYTGAPVPFPTGTLECAQRAGDTWGAPVSLGWQSITSPAVASYNGKLYAVFVRDGDQAVMWTRQDATGWRAPEPVGGDNSYYSPALAAFDGKLFCVVTGKNGKLYWRTYTETAGWSAVAQLPGEADKAQALAVYKDQLWATHLGPSGSINHYVYEYVNGKGRWGEGFFSNIPWRLTSPVTMASFKGRLWEIVRADADNTVWAASMDSGYTKWTNHQNVGGSWKTQKGMAAVTHSDHLWLFIRDMDGYLRAASSPQGGNAGWSATHYVSGTKAIKLIGEPSAVSHNGSLYAMYRR